MPSAPHEPLGWWCVARTMCLGANALDKKQQVQLGCPIAHFPTYVWLEFDAFWCFLIFPGIRLTRHELATARTGHPLVHSAATGALEAEWQALQLRPGIGERQAQERGLDALDGQRVAQDVARRGHYAHVWPVVLGHVVQVARRMVVLQAGDNALRACGKHPGWEGEAQDRQTFCYENLNT
jgi:hypothetical protein